jgi:hypothetical protein
MKLHKKRMALSAKRVGQTCANTGNNEGSGGKKNLPTFGEASFVLDKHVD